MNTMRRARYADHLRALLRGAGSIFDLFPVTPRLPDVSDADAIAADWRAVGDDLRAVLGDFEAAAAESGVPRAPGRTTALRSRS